MEAVQEVVDPVQEVDLDLVVVGGDSHNPVRIYAHKNCGRSFKRDHFVGSNVSRSLLYKFVKFYFAPNGYIPYLSP